MAVAPVKQQKGTAYPWEMTHSWGRNNFSCREDTPYLLRPGWGHVLVPGATEGCWVVLHMASMLPLDSQHRLRTSPAHLLLRGSKQSGPPCWLHFLLYIREHRAAQKSPHPGRLQATLAAWSHLCFTAREKTQPSISLRCTGPGRQTSSGNRKRLISRCRLPASTQGLHIQYL